MQVVAFFPSLLDGVMILGELPKMSFLEFWTIYTQVSSILDCAISIQKHWSNLLWFSKYCPCQLWWTCDVADYGPVWKCIQSEEANSPSIDGHHYNYEANQIDPKASFDLLIKEKRLVSKNCFLSRWTNFIRVLSWPRILSREGGPKISYLMLRVTICPCSIILADWIVMKTTGSSGLLVGVTPRECTCNFYMPSMSSITELPRTPPFQLRLKPRLSARNLRLSAEKDTNSEPSVEAKIPEVLN